MRRVLTSICPPPPDGSTPPNETLRILCPLATREYQIAHIESRGPNSRGVSLLRVGLANVAKIPPLEPSQPMVNLPLEATKQIHKSNGQFLRMYPKYTRS